MVAEEEGVSPGYYIDILNIIFWRQANSSYTRGVELVEQ